MAKKSARRGTSRKGVTSALKEFCRGLPGTTEDIKWEDDLIFSIGGKMYAGFDVEESDALGFKCDDIEFERLTKIDGVKPAPYAARFGWVLVERTGAMGEKELKRLLKRAYELVKEKLPAKRRREIDGVGAEKMMKKRK